MVAAILAAWPPLQRHLRAEKDRRAAKVLAQAELLTAMQQLGGEMKQLGGEMKQLGGEVKQLGGEVKQLDSKLDCLLVGVAVALTKLFST